MADIRLKISTEKYQQRISTLQGYVKQLETKRDNYRAKNREIQQIWKDSAEADQYYKVIDQEIEAITASITAANLNITQLQNIISNMDSTSGAISSAVTDAANTAADVFL